MKRVKKPRKSRAKVKFKTKTYVGNPGKKAEMKIDECLEVCLRLPWRPGRI